MTRSHSVRISDDLYLWLMKHAQDCEVSIDSLAERAILIYQGMIEREKEFFRKAIGNTEANA